MCVGRSKRVNMVCGNFEERGRGGTYGEGRTVEVTHQKPQNNDIHRYFAVQYSTLQSVVSLIHLSEHPFISFVPVCSDK